MSRPEPPVVTPVPLPALLRILDDWTVFDVAVHAACRELDRFGSKPKVDHGMAEEMVRAALAVAGVFTPAPALESLDAEYCTALFVPWETEAHAPDYPGEWQQCGDEPGHEGTTHSNGQHAWKDAQPGTLPARMRGEETGA